MTLFLPAKTLSGTVEAPPSKSYAHRMLICASLADGQSIVHCDMISEDIQATIRCLNSMGAKIIIKKDNIYVTPLDISNTAHRECILDCGESGTTLRFLLPIACALGYRARFILHGRLSERPMTPLYNELSSHGAEITSNGDSIIIAEGPLSNGEFQISGGVSSQFISGLLMALPITGGGTLRVEDNIQSLPYVLITIDCLKKAGIDVKKERDNIYRVTGHYKKRNWSVEGDWSNAAFWLCSGAFSENKLKVKGLNINSHQGDKKIIELIQQFGAKVEISPTAITVSPKNLNAIDIDAKDIPDLVPALCVCASAAVGKTRIYNAERLRYKESDRLRAVREVISSMGGRIEETSDGLVIWGVPSFQNSEVESWNDHRIAMMASIAAARCKDGLTLHGAECVRKSYPRFFNDYKILGGSIERVD
jgi:3-phosphoshikimate 1-carboxyvinyltransferase